MPYQLPAIGTVLPAKENDSVPNPGPTRSPEAFNRWLQAQAQDKAFQQNLVLVQEYDDVTFQNWLISYTAGRAIGPSGQMDGDPDARPPRPPAAYIVVVTDGQVFSVEKSGKPAMIDDDGNVVAQATGVYIPACPVPAYRKIPPPQHGTVVFGVETH